MKRREAIKLAAMSAAALAFNSGARARKRPGPILDAHIHLFDPTRPGGVPWPEPDDKALYRPALPPRYQALAAGFGVVGAIAVEASPLATDNQWLLAVAKAHPFIVGIVGDLVPGAPSYRADLDRLHADPLFLGFRYGNLWNRDLFADMDKPGFIEGLKALAQAGLVLESANPDARLVQAMLRISERVPGLRLVIDHLPHASLPTGDAALKEYWANLHALGQNPNVFIKLSEIPVVVNDKLVTDLAFYEGRLDPLWNAFGEDRILFGSDWPNSDHVAPYADTLTLVQRYIALKPPGAPEKYFWKNSIAAYKWRKRSPDQPSV